MRGLSWMMDRFHSAGTVISWAFKHQCRNRYGPIPTFRDTHTISDSEDKRPEPHPDLDGFGPDDYLAVAGKVLEDVRGIVGRDWPVIVLAYNSFSPEERLQASLAMWRRILKGQRREKYPRNYFLAISSAWRITHNLRPSLLVELSGKTRETEARWRADIKEALETMLDNLACKI